ncbi:protein of unknown function DUF1626 [Pyrolobus fumarii 1A]|uniref:DUF3782 domain-containing protein n=2 Tax=Pyrolobus fumarii TaxID=54252 RepID=G0EFV4_PYRF1|nr:protein of unknown function DUF1626 [Pyrolobus fumarii 1A]
MHRGLHYMASGTTGQGDLKRAILELLRSDWEFRRAVAAELGLLEILERLAKIEERMARIEERLLKVEERIEEHTRAIRALQEQVRSLQEQVKVLQEQVKALQEQMVKLQEQVLEHSKAIRALQEQVAKLEERIEEHSRVIRGLQEELRRFGDRLAALGSRWGLYAEEAVRESLRRFLHEYFGVAQVGKWEYFDREGVVFGYPTLIEVDVVVKDDTHYLVEVKSSVSVADVKVFNEKCKLYQKVVKPPKTKKIIVTCYADDRAREAAKALDVEIITR